MIKKTYISTYILIKKTLYICMYIYITELKIQVCWCHWFKFLQLWCLINFIIFGSQVVLNFLCPSLFFCSLLSMFSRFCVFVPKSKDHHIHSWLQLFQLFTVDLHVLWGSKLFRCCHPFLSPLNSLNLQRCFL